MGREVKRVALDFNWPLNKVWDGYLNPHYRQCAACDGTSYTVARRQFNALVNLLMIAGGDAIQNGRGRPRFHPYFDSSPLAGETPARDLALVTKGLAGREPSFFGHDSCDIYVAEQAILKAAGLSEDWGVCAACGGDAIDPDAKAAYEAWEPTEPPAGDGWQMWETTSEGSPISPVCASPEALAHWLADNHASTFGSDTTTYERWLAMIQSGWAPSMVVTGTTIQSGVDAASDH